MLDSSRRLPPAFPRQGKGEARVSESRLRARRGCLRAVVAVVAALAAAPAGAATTQPSEVPVETGTLEAPVSVDASALGMSGGVPAPAGQAAGGVDANPPGLSPGAPLTPPLRGTDNATPLEAPDQALAVGGDDVVQLVNVVGRIWHGGNAGP